MKNNTNIKADYNSTNVELSSLILVPIQNTYKKKIESSSINSLINYNLEHKELEKETKKGYLYRSQAVMSLNNRIINYLQNTNLSDKLDKIISIKNNSDSFNTYQNTQNEKKYYLEEILSLISLQTKDPKKKKIILNKLKRLQLLNRIRRNKDRTPILSNYLKKIVPLFVKFIKLNAYKNYIKTKEENLNQLLHRKSLIEYNFKVKYINSIEYYKNRNSLLYKSLPIEDKKLINFLLYIESKVLNLNLNKNKNKNINLLLTKKSLVKILTTFDSNELYSKNIVYNFKKGNTYNIYKNEKNIFSILESSFLSMDSLISKAIFSIKPKNIIINLFFF